MFSSHTNRGEKLPTYKLTVVQYGILFMMLALVGGLWRLQVLGANNFKQLAQANRIRKVPILAARGKLFDRYGRLLVDNYPSTSCFLVREQNHNIQADLPLIAEGLHLNLDQLQATIKRYRGLPAYRPIPIKEDITPDEVAFVAAHKNELPELETIEEARRLYPRNGFAAHLIGYVGEVSEDDLNDPRYAMDEPGDVVGKAGVEETYDELLRGQDGSRDVIVDSHGREMGFFGIQHAIPGQDLKLTIDNDIQRAAEVALGPREGAIVVMDPRNGNILAMVSHPAYDPNDFAVKISRAEWDQLITDPEHPMMNRAIQAQLAPGSTFKILMSLAGLDEGIAQTMKVYCAGGATFYGHFYACDQHHGEVDIEHAIPWSCDTYFYTLANRLGIDTIAKYAREVGLGQPTGIDLPGEASGNVPSTEWKLRTFHEKWFAGETISVGIGQGAVTVTPIQLARYISGIASDGHFVRPRVVDPSQLPASFRQALWQSFPGSGNKTISISPQIWDIITNGMAQATMPGGFDTAAASHLEGVDFAGKTGTAQVASHKAIAHMKGVDTRPNGWFVGVIPRRNPQFVITVLWQHGDWGSNAARLAADVATVYVNKQREQEHDVRLESPAQAPKPVEMGAIWTQVGPAETADAGPQEAGPQEAGAKSHKNVARNSAPAGQTTILHGGRFLLRFAPAAAGDLAATVTPSAAGAGRTRPNSPTGSQPNSLPGDNSR